MDFFGFGHPESHIINRVSRIEGDFGGFKDCPVGGHQGFQSGAGQVLANQETAIDLNGTGGRRGRCCRIVV